MKNLKTQEWLAWTASAYGVFCFSKVKISSTPRCAAVAGIFWAAAMSAQIFSFRSLGLNKITHFDYSSAFVTISFTCLDKPSSAARFLRATPIRFLVDSSHDNQSLNASSQIWAATVELNLSIATTISETNE